MSLGQGVNSELKLTVKINNMDNAGSPEAGRGNWMSVKEISVLNKLTTT